MTLSTLAKRPRRVTKRPRLASAPPPRALYVLSDSTGNLPRHVLGALLTQFPPDTVSLRLEPFVRTLPQLERVLLRARQDGAAVCHAMVSAPFKRSVESTCRRFKLPCHDLTGGTVTFLSDVTGLAARPDLAALHRLDEAYKRRIESMEFALGHDDGLGLDTLHAADIVLAGVSRTSKSPTSIYLAQLGYRVGNVALAMGIDPPSQLLSLPPRRVVGLVICPTQLTMIRARREAAWGMAGTNYGDGDHVAREVAWARRLFNQHGWPVVDVTDQSIEETAARVVSLAGLSTNALSPLPPAASPAQME